MLYTAVIFVGCDVNTMNRQGSTPLCVACEQGDTEIIEMLLEQPGMDVNAGYARLPLHAAVGHGHQAIALKLLEAGCDVNRVCFLSKLLNLST